jgi:hypothetical protein
MMELRLAIDMVSARWLACVGIAIASSACGPTKPPSRASHAGASAVPSRAPTFASQRSQPIYDHALEGMRAIDALRGSAMTEALATDLGFKCADLRSLRKSLEAEPDPVVWRLRTDIDKTCSFDVPVASAQFEIDRIQKKRAVDPGAGVEGECRALKLVIEDIGTGFIANPTAAGIIDKELLYCESADTVRRVP